MGNDTETLSVSPNNCLVQPVDLILFNGLMVDDKINLIWKTSNEKNFSHFEVQKGIDAKEFGGFAVVKGTNANIYNSIDNNPIEGLNYYRLKMIDVDGTSKLSNIISVNFEKGRRFITVENPTNSGAFKVMTNLKNPSFNLLTTLGSRVEFEVIESTINMFTLKVKNSVAGVYFLRIASEGKVVTKKVLFP